MPSSMSAPPLATVFEADEENMKGFAELTAGQRAVLESLEDGDLLLVMHPIVGQDVALDDESEEEYIESDSESGDDDQDADSVMSASDPANIALPATADDDIEESVNGSTHVPPQVYVVAATSKAPTGALISLILTPMTYTQIHDPLDSHSFRIFGKETCHSHNSPCSTCPPSLDFTTIDADTMVERNPSGDTIRIVDATNFPAPPDGCHVNCRAGFLHAPDSLNGLFDSYIPPLNTYLCAHNISTAVFLPTLQRIVCPVCIGLDILQEQQILQTELLQSSFVDFDDVFAFLSRLNPRRKELGLSYLQFDEREWGFYFNDMLEDIDEEDEDDEEGDDEAFEAGNDRWQQWDEAMDPNATIAISPTPAEVVAALHRILFGHTKRAKEALDGEVLKCRICLDDMQEMTKVAELPCGHADCEECVVEWLKAKDSCHVCRGNVAVGSQKKDNDGNDEKCEDKGEEQIGEEVVVDRDGDVEMGENTDDEDEAEGGAMGADIEEEDSGEDMAELIAAAMAVERRLSNEAGEH